MTRKPHQSPASPGVWRVIAAFLIPPLAVIDKGWDKALITFLLWAFMWPVGMAAAFYFLLSGRHYDALKAELFGSPAAMSKPKREAPVYHEPDYREYIELADGEVLEVVDPDDDERRQRLSR
jgi:uncharacterized membrane protein YqaE (UPF0057 family)